MIRLGEIVMFSGDFRRVMAAIKNVTSFSAVTAVLKNGDTDVTSTYIDTTPTSSGNILISDLIGGKASIPSGNYRYFISGTHSGIVTTWYWDVLVLPQDLTLLTDFDLPTGDYNPFANEVTLFEDDSFVGEFTIPGADFSAVTGVLRLGSSDVTSSYCSGSASFSGETLTTHGIGGTPIPAGEYGYFITGTYSGGDVKATWLLVVRVLAKQGVL